MRPFLPDSRVHFFEMKRVWVTSGPSRAAFRKESGLLSSPFGGGEGPAKGALCAPAPPAIQNAGAPDTCAHTVKEILVQVYAVQSRGPGAWTIDEEALALIPSKLRLYLTLIWHRRAHRNLFVLCRVCRSCWFLCFYCPTPPIVFHGTQPAFWTPRPAPYSQ